VDGNKLSLVTYGRFPRGALIQGGVIVHIDPFEKHEQRIGGVLLFWYANPTLIRAVSWTIRVVLSYLNKSTPPYTLLVFL
jgi:hypothetical protein